MKRELKREKTLKTLLLGHWIQTRFNPHSMATVIDIDSVLGDPFAYADIVLNTNDRETVHRLLDMIGNGDFETHINNTANALRAKDDYSAPGSVQATREMLDAMSIDLSVKENNG